MATWFLDHGWWLTIASAALFLGGLAVGLAIVIAMPADYFSRPHRRFDLSRSRHPTLRFVLRILKNLAGACLLLFGLITALPLIPGPGMLFILLGVSLVDLPGKRALERYIVTRRFVSRSINALRSRWNRPPLDLTNDLPPSSLPPPNAEL